MARTQSDNTATEKNQRNPPLQITCEPEFKADVEDLARAFGYSNTSTFLREIVAEYVEINREQITRYRELIASPLIKPKPKRQRNKKTFATMPTAGQDKPTTAANSGAEACIDTAKGGDDRAQN